MNVDFCEGCGHESGFHDDDGTCEDCQAEGKDCPGWAEGPREKFQVFSKALYERYGLEPSDTGYRSHSDMPEDISVNEMLEQLEAKYGLVRLPAGL